MKANSQSWSRSWEVVTPELGKQGHLSSFHCKLYSVRGGAQSRERPAGQARLCMPAGVRWHQKDTESLKVIHIAYVCPFGYWLCQGYRVIRYDFIWVHH